MRVLIADDSVLLREGLTFILDDGGHEVIAAVGSGTELVPRALELRPELIITDIRMPPSNTDEGCGPPSRSGRSGPTPRSCC